MDCIDCLKKFKQDKYVTSACSSHSQVVKYTAPTVNSQEARTENNVISVAGENTGSDLFSQLPQSQPITIEFNDLTYTVPVTRRKGHVKKERQQILKGVSGRFRPGQLTAIMGPSGAGKSTLLNVLAGCRVKNVGGSVMVNGVARNLHTFRRIQAYIMQEDHILPYLSVDEAMHAAANLKLGNGFSSHERVHIVNTVLQSLGLSPCRNTRCLRLSGGQKKRLSIALELINNPPVMFFDEPTSGLDSTSCSSCVALLKNLAMGGRTIVCTIHQPSSRLFELFDQLYVLAAGRCIYHGLRRLLVPALADAGLQCPEYHNPADFVIEAASGEYGDWCCRLVEAADNGTSRQWTDDTTHEQCSVAGSECCDPEESSSTESSSAIGVASSGACTCHTEDHLSVPHCANDSQKAVDSVVSGGSGSSVVALDTGREHYRTSASSQFCVLLQRTFKSIIRDRMLTTTRLLSHTLFAVMIGGLYFNIGDQAAHVYNNAAQLFFAVMFLMFSALMPTILTFPLEMNVFRKEYINCWYSVKSYYMAKTIADFPFQVVFPILYNVIVYFMTSQPMEVNRFFMFCLITIFTSLVAQSLGVVIGACCDIQLAVFLGPICMIPLILFSGFFVNLNTMPSWISWMSYLSFCRYSFEGLMLAVYGFDRDNMHCSQPFCLFRSPRKFLKEMDMEGAQFWVDVAVLAALTVGLRLIGYFVLRFKLKMER